MAVVHVTSENYSDLTQHSQKTVLLDFWASWCAPCQMISPVIEEIAHERSDIVVGKVNVDEEYELTRNLRVISIPTFLVLKDGKVTNRDVGVMEKHEILNML